MNSNYSEDEELLKRIKAEEETLIRQLFDQYWFYFGPLFLKRKDLTFEKVKEVYTFSFTEMVMNIIEGKLKPPLKSSLKVYLVGIGKNFTNRHLDKRKRNREDQFDDLEASVVKLIQPDIEIQHQEEDLAAEVERTLKQLDPGCRDLLTLSFLEENADDAIAEKMNIASTGAVRQRRFKCLEKLRKLLGIQKFETDGKN